MNRFLCHVAAFVLAACALALFSQVVAVAVEAYAFYDCKQQGYIGTYDPKRGCVWSKP